MGICSSCLGLGRRPSDAEHSDSSHLLGDPYQPGYGSMNPAGTHGAPQLDPEEIRRQRDALERICAQASDKLIDVSQAHFADDGPKMISEYPRLFTDRFAPSALQLSRPASVNSSPDEDETAWLGHVAGTAADTDGKWERVRPTHPGALTIQFGDGLA
ncbi:hypothetical protein EJ04DRAFT_512514 [Polyplosphaeria fusca]|uniref:Uncharacterized protein n=1 Tax=Polyplosphaeria fusca TaxID=682080 RepID=A0A9P4QXR6_9PLEO|nr:hypothetical protein EJ04DRAFT_512514 [Polyplosphaeria fusca]